MRVLLLGTAHPYRGGLASFNERLMEEFEKQGHTTAIFTFTVQYPNFLFPGKTQYSNSPKPEGLTIERKINSVNPINWLLVARQVRKWKPDLIILKYWIPFIGPSLGTIVRLGKGKAKVISILDNVIPHEHRPGDRLLTTYFTGSCHGFIGMSKSVLADLDTFKNTKNKPRTFSPHPIFDNFGSIATREESLDFLKLAPNYRYVLFFGFIRDYKGLDLLLNAFADERIKNMSVRLIVAGEYYSDQEKYEKLMKHPDLVDRVMAFNEFIPNEEVRYYFGAADLIAQPYKTATQSGVTQIGFHFEKPMLVTNVGGLGEIIKHNESGYVVEPDPTEIATSIVDFFEKEKSKQMVESIRKEKERFSWSTMVENLIKIKDSLMGSR